MGSISSRPTTSDIQKSEKKMVRLSGKEYFLSKELYSVTLSTHIGDAWKFEIIKAPKHPKLNQTQLLEEIYKSIQNPLCYTRPIILKNPNPKDMSDMFYCPDENENMLVVLNSEVIGFKDPLKFEYVPRKKNLEDYYFLFIPSNDFRGENILKLEKYKLFINKEADFLCHFSIKMKLREKKKRGNLELDYKDKLKEKLDLHLDVEVDDFHLFTVMEPIVQLENNLDFKTDFFLKIKVKGEGLLNFTICEPKTKSSKDFTLEILSNERIIQRDNEILEQEKKEFLAKIKKSILDRFEQKVKKDIQQSSKNVSIHESFMKKVRELKQFQLVKSDEFIWEFVKDMKEITSMNKSKIYTQICDVGLENLKKDQIFMDLLKDEVSNQLSQAVDEKLLGDKKKKKLEEHKKGYQLIRNLDIFHIDFDISSIYTFLYYEKNKLFLDYQNEYQFEIEVKLKHKALNKYLDEIPQGFNINLILYCCQSENDEIVDSKIVEIQSYKIQKDKSVIHISMERLNDVMNSIEKFKNTVSSYSFVFMIGETFKTTPLWTISEKDIETVKPIQCKYYQQVKYSLEHETVHIMFKDSLIHYGLNPINYCSFMIGNQWNILQDIDNEFIDFIDFTKELYFFSPTKSLDLQFNFGGGSNENKFLQNFNEFSEKPEVEIAKYKKQNSYDNFKFGLLTHMASRGKLNWVKKLIEEGLLIDEKDVFGFNCIDWAFRMKEYKTVEYLLDVYFKDEIINLKEDVTIHLMMKNVSKNLDIDQDTAKMSFEDTMKELSNVYNNLFRSIHSPKYINDFEKLLDKGVENEIPEALFYVGSLYFYGTIKRQSLDDARFYLEKAAEKFEENSLVFLSNYFGDNEATKKLLDLFEQGKLRCEASISTLITYYLKNDERNSDSTLYIKRIVEFLDKVDKQNWDLKNGDIVITLIMVTSFVNYKLMKKYYREYIKKELVSRFSNQGMLQNSLMDKKSEGLISLVDFEPYLKLLESMKNDPSALYFLASEKQLSEPEKAKEMFLESSKNGYKPSNNKLALILLKEMDSSQDKQEVLKKAIGLLKDCGNFESRKILALLHYYGKDDGNGKVKRNQEKAIKIMKEILICGERESVYYLSMWIKETDLIAFLDELILKDVDDEVLNHILNIYFYLLDFKKVEFIYSKIQYFNLSSVSIINEKKEVIREFEDIRNKLKDKTMDSFEELTSVGNGASAKIKYVKCKLDDETEKEFALKEIPIEYNDSFKPKEYMMNDKNFRDFSFLLKDGKLEILHPNIIYIYHYFINPKKKTLDIIMPYFVRSLQSVIDDRFTDISDKLLVNWISSLSNVLLRLSIKKIAHLDIKPLNIMLNFDLSIIYLIDFGEYIDCSDGWIKVLTKEILQDKKSLGTHGFRAPEIEKIQKNQVVDFEKVDLYSMGIVFEKMKQKATTSLAKKIDVLIKKMKQKDPQKRINCYDLYLETESMKKIFK